MTLLDIQTGIKPQTSEPQTFDPLVNPSIENREAVACSELLRMLTTKRPHDTMATLKFAQTWLKPLGAKIDERGNWYLRIGVDGKRGMANKSKVLWSSHIDTVHWGEGTQKTRLNPTTGYLTLHYDEKLSGCLGSDCTTGVWLMREMALANVPGLYIWHEAEECGGTGSRHIANKTPKMLAGIEAAIAFDRKGFESVITSQSGGMCCSETFSKSLAAMLPGNYKSDPTGTFTDTANYTDLIAECTNISVGYFDQHTKREAQHIPFALTLRKHMLQFDESKLTISRKPGDMGTPRYKYYGGHSGYGGYGYDYDYDDWSSASTTKYTKYTKPTTHLTSEEYQKISYFPKTKSKATKCGGLCGGSGKCKGLCTSGLAKKYWDRQAELDAIFARDHKDKPVKLVKLVSDTSRTCQTLKAFVILYPDLITDLLEQYAIDLKYLYDSYPDAY